MAAFQTVKGFRDFFPEDCARRNYIFAQWRSIAQRYGFAEYEGALIEPTALYKKKSGDEITAQLFNFVDKGGREIALRPEVTPSLARMAAERQRHYTKPLKWFQIGSCFRYEEPQRGRTREFTQFNADIIGEPSPAADAELIALAVDLMLSLGFTKEDFQIRLSSRRLWSEFLIEQKIDTEHSPAFLTIIDKLERVPEEVTDKKLQAIGLSLAKVKTFMASVGGAIASVSGSGLLYTPLVENLKARGLLDCVSIDPGIVRGLAYYTGTVFEVFDLKHSLRAVAGGGRYDGLVSLISDGGTDMPACGFAMGDVVLNELINRTDEAKKRADEWAAATNACDAYVVIADETRRSDALGILQQLRSAGIRTDYALTPAKVGKQFQAAENSKARFAIIIGVEGSGEKLKVEVKNLRTRDQMEIPSDNLTEKLKELMLSPDYLPRLA